MKELFEYFYNKGDYYFLEWLYKDPSGEEHLIKLKSCRIEQAPNMDAVTNNWQTSLKALAARIARDEYRDSMLSRGDLHTIKKKLNRDREVEDWD